MNGDDGGEMHRYRAQQLTAGQTAAPAVASCLHNATYIFSGRLHGEDLTSAEGAKDLVVGTEQDGRRRQLHILCRQ
jgi:hypothetical protein